MGIKENEKRFNLSKVTIFYKIERGYRLVDVTNPEVYFDLSPEELFNLQKLRVKK